MSLFRKNPNEALYQGGKKHWIDVIKNTGPGEALIWRQPEEDFNTNSTLIVMPGEQAIFVKGGTVEQVFENGTYKLSTENYPFISRLRNILTGGISVFNCVVYFVRSADSEEIIWGTDSPIPVRDKVWGIRTEARARGAYKVRIVNPAKFLEKMVGNNVDPQYYNDLGKYFRHELQGRVKSSVSKLLNALTQELIGIDAYLDELSEKVTPYIDEALSDYGLKCVRFSLSGLDIDVSKYDELDKSQMELIARTRGYQGDRAGLDILGNDWNKVQAFGIMKDVANNPNAGSMPTFGASLGMGLGSGMAFGNMAQQVLSPNNIAVNQQPQQAPTQQPAQAQPVQDDPIEALAKLKKLFDAGLIDQADYDAKKAEILKRL